jgi:hypothetical protein
MSSVSMQHSLVGPTATMVPACRYIARSAMRIACSRLCVTITQVIWRSRMMPSKSSSIARADRSSRAEVGSSSNKDSGAFASVRASNALSFPSRQTVRVAILVAGQADAFERRGNLLLRRTLTALHWSEGNVRCHRPREQVGHLQDHPDAAS